MNTDPLPEVKRKSKYALAIIALLTVLPASLFYLTVRLELDGGIDVLFRFWNYLPYYLFRYIILILPIPPIALGAYSLWLVKKRQAKGTVIGLAALIVGLILTLFCYQAAFVPNG